MPLRFWRAPPLLYPVAAPAARSALGSLSAKPCGQGTHPLGRLARAHLGPPRLQCLPHPVCDLVRRGTRGEDTGDAHLGQAWKVSVGDDPTTEHADVLGVL